MKLKELRARIGMTQKQLAKEMETTQQTIARWETGKTLLNVDQVRNLSVILQCSAEDLLGWESEPGELPDSPFASMGREIPYGTLQVGMRYGNREYPVSEKARESLLKQTEALEPTGSGKEDAWLYAWTLNNKLLLINPEYLKRFKLLSDDVVAMPSFESPEVYRALEAWPVLEVTGKIKQHCDELAASLGSDDDVFHFTSEVRITYDDGSDEWCNLSDEMAMVWGNVVMMLDYVGQRSLLQIDEVGPHEAVFARSGRVAVIEIPFERFLRLTTPSDN